MTFTKEQKIAAAQSRIWLAEMMLSGELEPLKERSWAIELELARIALASLEAEPVAFINGAREPVLYGAYIGIAIATQLYTAQPAPVSVPDFKKLAHELVENLVDCNGADDSAIKQYLKWTEKTCRAAMLQ